MNHRHRTRLGMALAASAALALGMPALASAQGQGGVGPGAPPNGQMPSTTRPSTGSGSGASGELGPGGSRAGGSAGGSFGSGSNAEGSFQMTKPVQPTQMSDIQRLEKQGFIAPSRIAIEPAQPWVLNAIGTLPQDEFKSALAKVQVSADQNRMAPQSLGAFLASNGAPPEKIAGVIDQGSGLIIFLTKSGPSNVTPN